MESKACELPIIISSSIPETKKNEIILIMVVVDLNTYYVQGGTHRRTNGVKWSHWSWKKWLWRFEATPRLVGVRPCGIHHLFDEMPRKPCDTATLHGSRARIQYFFLLNAWPKRRHFGTGTWNFLFLFFNLASKWHRFELSLK